MECLKCNNIVPALTFTLTRVSILVFLSVCFCDFNFSTVYSLVGRIYNNDIDDGNDDDDNNNNNDNSNHHNSDNSNHNHNHIIVIVIVMVSHSHSQS